MNPRVSQALAQLSDGAARPLPAAARERALYRAMRAAATGQPARAPSPRGVPWLPCAAALCAALCFLSAAPRPPAEPRAGSSPHPELSLPLRPALRAAPLASPTPAREARCSSCHKA